MNQWFNGFDTYFQTHPYASNTVYPVPSCLIFSGRFPNLNDGEMGPISGWWLTYPSEKYESQLDAYSQYMET